MLASGILFPDCALKILCILCSMSSKKRQTRRGRGRGRGNKKRKRQPGFVTRLEETQASYGETKFTMLSVEVKTEGKKAKIKHKLSLENDAGSKAILTLNDFKNFLCKELEIEDDRIQAIQLIEAMNFKKVYKSKWQNVNTAYQFTQAFTTNLNNWGLTPRNTGGVIPVLLFLSKPVEDAKKPEASATPPSTCVANSLLSLLALNIGEKRVTDSSVRHMSNSNVQNLANNKVQHMANSDVQHMINNRVPHMINIDMPTRTVEDTQMTTDASVTVSGESVHFAHSCHVPLKYFALQACMRTDHNSHA